MQKGIFYGIGIGPGDPELITVKAARILGIADVIAIPESKKEKGSLAYDIAKQYLKNDARTMVLTFPMIYDDDAKAAFRKENAGKIREEIENGNNVVFITLGDPMIYSTYIYLLECLKDQGINVQIIPGITSFSAVASILGIPLVKGNEKFCVIPDYDDSTEKMTDLFDCIIFMKVSTYKEKIVGLLKKKESSFFLISNAGKKNEKIINNIPDLEKEQLPYFSTLIMYKKVT